MDHWQPQLHMYIYNTDTHNNSVLNDKKLGNTENTNSRPSTLFKKLLDSLPPYVYACNLVVTYLGMYCE